VKFEVRTMRVKWWMGFLTIVVAAPFGAQAEQQFKVSDFWYSPQDRRAPELPRLPVGLGSQSDSLAAIREGSAIRAVDTYMRPIYLRPLDYARRGSEARTPVVSSGGTASRSAPATTPPSAAAAAPEVSAGVAATGLTLLFGCVAILRGRRTRSHA
jgi:hypothetical protein